MELIDGEGRTASLKRREAYFENMVCEIREQREKDFAELEKDPVWIRWKEIKDELSRIADRLDHRTNNTLPLGTMYCDCISCQITLINLRVEWLGEDILKDYRELRKQYAELNSLQKRLIETLKCG